MSGSAADETQSLRRTVRDLAALSSLPAGWTGQQPRDVAEGLADAIQGALHPDFVYLVLGHAPDEPCLEAVRLGGRHATSSQAQRVRKQLAHALESPGRRGPLSLPNPSGHDVLNGQMAPIGPGGAEGVIVVGSQLAGFPSELDQLLLNVLANQAVIWGRQARLIAERQQAERLLAKLNQLGPVFAAELNLDRLVQAVTDASTQLIGAEFGAFFYEAADDNGQRIARYALAGSASEVVARIARPSGIPLFSAAAPGIGIVRSANIGQDPRYAHLGLFPQMVAELPVLSYLAAPVVTRAGQLLGGLFFGHSQPDMFSERHEQLVAGLAAQAAIAIDNARLYQAERTAREQLEARVEARTSQLLQSETRFGLLVNSVQDYAIFMLDTEGRVASWNPGAARLKGYTAEEIIGQNFSCFYAPADAARGEPQHNLALALQRGHYEAEGWRIRKDRSKFWANVVITPVRDAAGELVGYAKVTRDLTERKRNEDELRASREQLRQLSAHLEQAREQERARIAREIHDELGGTLTGLKMDVVQLRRHTDWLEAGVAEKLDALALAIDNTVQTVRRIASELRPAILDDFGLLAAMEWQMREFERRSGIGCQWQSDLVEVDLGGDGASAVFRVFQESLTNIARHAQASQVQVWVAAAAGRLELTIQDNGIGITPEQSRGAGSLGLAGIRERMALLGGVVDIQGQASGGTRVQVSVPLPKARE